MNEILFLPFSQKLFFGDQSYGLLAIPPFMLACEIMSESDLTKQLANFARLFVGGLRSGLAYTT